MSDVVGSVTQWVAKNQPAIDWTCPNHREELVTLTRPDELWDSASLAVGNNKEFARGVLVVSTLGLLDNARRSAAANARLGIGSTLSIDHT